MTDQAPPKKRALTWRMRPRTRKTWLFCHVAISVGWLGGAYAMLMMAIAARTSAGEHLRPAAYELMHLSDTVIMIPCALGTLITGLVTGLYGKWRVLHHWWVLDKLVLTVGAAVFAYVYIAQSVKEALARTEADYAADIGVLEDGVIAGSAGMLVLLTTTTLLSTFKPWGRTRWGRRAKDSRQPGAAPRPERRERPERQRAVGRTQGASAARTESAAQGVSSGGGTP
ncbi:hypothetical protein DVA86_07695 [Streptomyces armeniacus]|uniref:DUF2269 domain-containing protein n=1 Tax=Streptomyces armeniacus TaxID=83291 RepID=A0A345XLN3_9ACTN|nr:hypothetical protein [Streptomyces armeniacus]AXK32549.1 hypothetical protein DVA86_07695 [Streptomyces armeniacus]